jgi:hypothetical protein
VHNLLHHPGILIQLVVVKRRLHHAAMSEVDGFFVGEQSATQHLVHALKAHTLHKGVLLLHRHIHDRLGTKDGNEELPPKKKEA